MLNRPKHLVSIFRGDIEVTCQAHPLQSPTDYFFVDCRTLSTLWKKLCRPTLDWLDVLNGLCRAIFYPAVQRIELACVSNLWNCTQQFHLITMLRFNRVLKFAKIMIQNNQTHLCKEDNEQNNYYVIAFVRWTVFLMPHFFLIRKHLSWSQNINLPRRWLFIFNYLTNCKGITFHLCSVHASYSRSVFSHICGQEYLNVAAARSKGYITKLDWLETKVKAYWKL